MAGSGPWPSLTLQTSSQQLAYSWGKIKSHLGWPSSGENRKIIDYCRQEAVGFIPQEIKISEGSQREEEPKSEEKVINATCSRMQEAQNITSPQWKNVVLGKIPSGLPNPIKQLSQQFPQWVQIAITLTTYIKLVKTPRNSQICFENQKSSAIPQRMFVEMGVGCIDKGRPPKAKRLPQLILLAFGSHNWEL